MNLLKDKLVFITGASSGIGAACAKAFAQAGAKLLLCARSIDKLNDYVQSLQTSFKTDIFAFQLDVTNYAAVTTALQALPPEWQPIDILLNNAGLAAGFDAVQTGDIQDWEQMIDTNVKGLLYITREILPMMVKRNSGHIINIGSIAGHEVYPKGAVYCATKFAVNALSKGLRMDVFGTNIRVSSIDPGAVETNFSLVRFKGNEKRAAAVYEGIAPLTAEDVADTVLYCASRPPHVNISEVLMMPTDQASATMFARKSE